MIRAVDYWVHRYDPLAVIRSKAAAKDRFIEFGDKDDPDGVVSFWGRMRATDAKITDARADELADSVCAEDPRTKRERRADAVAAAMAGADRLTCLCDNPDCAGSGKDPRAGAVNIYVLTGQQPDTGHGTPPHTGPTGPTPPAPNGPDPEQPPEEPAADTEQPAPGEAPEAEPESPAAPAAQYTAPGAGAGICLDGDIIPADLIADLVNGGAKVRFLSSPEDLGSEPRYRP